VVAEQAIGVAEPAVALEYPAEQLAEEEMVVVVSKDRFARVTAGVDVIRRAGEADPVRTSDRPTLAAALPRVYCLKPDVTVPSRVSEFCRRLGEMWECKT